MKLLQETAVGTAPATVRKRVVAFETWREWIPGLVDLEVDPQPDGHTDIVMALQAPRQLQLRIAVEPTDTGFRFALVEGDVSTASGELTVSGKGRKSRLVLELELEFPVRIPGALLRELEEETLPRWLAALADSVSPPRKPPARRR
ncbi:MAG: SRPBCC family protein [Deltaproteobacteria bacterium]|nr:SRPBCC family protein [Deltaproteobacteria bacterium]